MAIFKPDFEESNSWPEDISRIDRRDPNRSLADRLRTRFDERRKVTEILENVHRLSENNWGFIDTAPTKLESYTEEELTPELRYNSQKFTKSIDRIKLNCHSDGKYWSYIQIVNRDESDNSEIKNQILVYWRFSRAIDENEKEEPLKFKNLKSGEAFRWDGKYTPEWEIILMKKNGENYKRHWKIYLRDPENPIMY